MHCEALKLISVFSEGSQSPVYLPEYPVSEKASHFDVESVTRIVHETI